MVDRAQALDRLSNGRPFTFDTTAHIPHSGTLRRGRGSHLFQDAARRGPAHRNSLGFRFALHRETDTPRHDDGDSGEL